MKPRKRNRSERPARDSRPKLDTIQPISPELLGQVSGGNQETAMGTQSHCETRVTCCPVCTVA